MARKPVHDKACLACAYLNEITLTHELTEQDIDHVYVSKDRWEQLEALFTSPTPCLTSSASRRKQLVYKCGIVSLYHPRSQFWFTHIHQYQTNRLELTHEEDQEILVFRCSSQERYGDFVGRIWPAKHTNEK